MMRFTHTVGISSLGGYGILVYLLALLIPCSAFPQSSYIDNREVSVFRTESEAFEFARRLYVIFEMDATIFYESGKPLGYSTIMMTDFVKEVCPMSRSQTETWVGGYAILRGDNKKLFLQPVEWLANHKERRLIIGFSNYCEPEQEDPEQPIDIDLNDTVEVSLIIDRHENADPIKIVSTVRKIYEADSPEVWLLLNSTACESNDSSQKCKWERVGIPCAESRDDRKIDGDSCPSGPTIGYRYGKAAVAAAVACIQGFGYAIQNCIVGNLVDVPVETSAAGEFELRHVPARSTPPHKANFDGIVKAKLRCEVKRSGGLNVNTAVAATAAYLNYSFSSDGQFREAECKKTLEAAISVGHRGSIRITLPNKTFEITASPGDSDVKERTIYIHCRAKCAEYMSLIGETGAGIKVQAFQGRASACVQMDTEECRIKGTCRYSRGDDWDIRKHALCCDEYKQSNVFKCQDIFR